MKIYARKMMKGNTAKVFFDILLCNVFRLTALIFIGISVCSIAYGNIFSSEEILYTVLSFFGGAICLLLSAVYTFYIKAKIYYSIDRKQTRPKRVLTIRYAAKYIRASFEVNCRKAMWLILFIFPFTVVLYFGSGVLKDPGTFNGILPVYSAALAVLSVGAILFYSVTTARYELTAYLLYLNPLLPAREAVISSAKLTEGKLLYIAVKKLSMLPWMITELFIIPLPFAAVYRRYHSAVLHERIYGENKKSISIRRSAVTFYINGKTKIAEAES